MVGPISQRLPVADLQIDDFSQEIDEPFGDPQSRREEPTLTKIDFEENEIALDL
jgi:hypothetical protein